MIVVVMGVAGAGKTTVGRLLAERIGAVFVDADNLHPAANIEKMRNRVALSDADRWPWLSTVVDIVKEKRRHGVPVVIACSALKRRYRAFIIRGLGPLRLVLLRGDEHLIATRLRKRRDHFFDASLLGTQVAALEEPSNCIAADIRLPPGRIAGMVAQRLELP